MTPEEFEDLVAAARARMTAGAAMYHFDMPPSDLPAGTWSNMASSMMTRERFMEIMKAFLAECLPPSDRGLSGAIPLPPATWAPPPVDDAEWAEQNREINDLLMGRANA